MSLRPLPCYSINSSPPSAAYMHQWIRSALYHIMACHLFSAKPFSKPILDYGQLDPKEQTSVKFSSKYKTFHSIQESATENIFCEMAVILSRGRWVKDNIATVKDTRPLVLQTLLFCEYHWKSLLSYELTFKYLDHFFYSEMNFTFQVGSLLK